MNIFLFIIQLPLVLLIGIGFWIKVFTDNKLKELDAVTLFNVLQDLDIMQYHQEGTRIAIGVILWACIISLFL